MRSHIHFFYNLRIFDIQIKIERPFSYPLSTDYHSYENVDIKKEEIMTMGTVKKETTKNEEKNEDSNTKKSTTAYLFSNNSIIEQLTNNEKSPEKVMSASNNKSLERTFLYSVLSGNVPKRKLSRNILSVNATTINLAKNDPRNALIKRNETETVNVDRRHSTNLRDEMPALLAHVKVSERASNFNKRHQNTPKVERAPIRRSNSEYILTCRF